MKILLIGGNGFIGRNILPLLRREHDVSILSRKSSQKDEIAGDITDLFSLNKLPKYDLIINLVGLSPLKKPKKEKGYEKVHVEGVRNIIEFAKNKEITRILHISALGSDPNSKFEYLKSKYEAEQLIINSGLEHIILKPSLVLGEDNELMRILQKFSLSRYSLFPNIQQKVQPIQVEKLATEIKRYINGWNSNKNSIKYPHGDEINTFGKIVKKEGENADLKIILIPIPNSLFLLIVRFGGLIGLLPRNAHLAMMSDNVFSGENSDKS